MPVIASLLGHADTRMTEKHYGHLSPSYVADTLRANLLLRLSCAVVILFGLYGAMQLYGSHYRAHTHDTIAQRKQVLDCIEAGGGVDACDARYYPQGAYCNDAISMTCFSTIFKSEGD